MYSAVFSALMTLMGLSFAAIGLLLQAQERHWVRHARIWRSISPNLVWCGVVISFSSFFSLVNITTTEQPTYSLTWWIVLVSFVVSLASLSILIKTTVTNLRAPVILRKMIRSHFPRGVVDFNDQQVGKFFIATKQLLTATQDVRDLTTYEEILDIAVVGTATPNDSMKIGRGGLSIATEISNHALIARAGLRELRAQMDYALDNRATFRAVTISCLAATNRIVGSWLGLEPAVHVNPDDASATVASRQAVLDGAATDIGHTAEMLLSAPRPSLTLVTEVAVVCRTLSPNVTGEPALGSVTRVLNGALRAVEAGYPDEAVVVLEGVRPWLTLSWTNISLMFRLVTVDQQSDRRLGEFIAEVVSEFVHIDDILTPDDITSLMPRMVEFLADGTPDLPPRILNSILQLIPIIAAKLGDTGTTKPYLDAVAGAHDDVLHQFVQSFVVHTGVAENFEQPFRQFLVNRVASYGLQPDEAVQKMCQWTYPAGRYIARNRPERLYFFRRNLVEACRSLGESVNVNPIFVTLTAARAVEERAILQKNADVPGIPQSMVDLQEGALSGLNAGSLSSTRRSGYVRPARAPFDNRLRECGRLMHEVIAERRSKGLDPGFSRELRRSLLGSTSFLLVDLEVESPGTQVGILHNEDIVASCELALSCSPLDLGDVSLYASRLVDAARIALSTTRPSNAVEENLLLRWYQIHLLASVVMAASEGKAVPQSPGDGPEPEHDVTEPLWDPPFEIQREFRRSVAELLDVVRDRQPDVAADDLCRRYDGLVTEAALLNTAFATSYGENPEKEIIDAWSRATGRNLDLHDRTCARLLVAVVRRRLPEWAKGFESLVERYLRDDDVGGAFYALRVVRSCSKKNGDETTFFTNGLFYSFNAAGIDDPASGTWLVDAIDALARDWLAHGFTDNANEAAEEGNRIASMCLSVMNRRSGIAVNVSADSKKKIQQLRGRARDRNANGRRPG